MERNLLDETLARIFSLYRQYQYNQPENRAADVEVVYKALKERGIPVSRELEIALYWDGGKGGTKYTVDYAAGNGPVIHNLHQI